MTISTLVVKNSYNGDGSATSFAYQFPIHTTAELKVIERSALGVETVKTLGTHYSITDNGASGGNVVFGTAPASGVTVVLIRDTNLTQEVDYIENDAFPAETHEAAIDKLTLQIQEAQEEIDRSLKISRTSTITSSELTKSAAERANKVLTFDNSGELSLDTSSVDVSAVAGIASAIANVSSISAAVSAANTNSANINTVAASNSSITTLAGISGLGTLAANNANITSLAAITSAISTNASNISAIQNASANATSAASSASSAAASASSAAASAGGGTVKVTSNDTAPNSLDTKLLVSGNLSKTVNNAGGNETLTLAITGGAEVYGFHINSSNNLIVTTTNSGADNISASEYANFVDVIYSSVGFSWSLDSTGHLIATI